MKDETIIVTDASGNETKIRVDEQTKRYRMLEVNESINVGDEVRKGCQWEATPLGGQGCHMTRWDIGFFRRPLPDLWAPTHSPQTMPDGPEESFEAYRAKLVAKVVDESDVPEMAFGHDPREYD